MTQWWYALDGQQQGPVTYKELVSLLEQGTLDGDTLIWSKGQTDWQALKTVADFAKFIPEAAAAQDRDPSPGNATDSSAVAATSAPTPVKEPAPSGEAASSVMTSNAVAAQTAVTTRKATPLGKVLLVLSTLVAVLAIGGFVYDKVVTDKKAEIDAQQIQQQLLDQKKQLAEAKQRENDAKAALAKKAREVEEAKKQAALAQARADEEAKQRAAAEAKAAAGTPSGPSTAPAEIVKANCTDFTTCFQTMLQAAYPLRAPDVDAAAAKIAALNQYSRGDRRTARDLNQRGLEAFNREDFVTAANLFKQAGESDQGDVEIWSNLGYAYIKQRKQDPAGSALTHAMVLNPARTSTWTAIAEYYTLNNDTQTAVSCLLLAFKYSANAVKTVQYFQDKSETETNAVLKSAYARAIQVIRSGNAGYTWPF